MENALVAQQNNSMSLTESNTQMVARVKGRIETLQTIYRQIMVEGKNGSDGDYGRIPGCGDKPALKKAGAEKLILGFRVSPTIGDRIKTTNLENGHREVTVVCTLLGMGGEILGEGVGSCSTMESKYRYRNVADYNVQETLIPKDAKDKKQEYRKQGFGMKQVEGVWKWVKYKDSQRQENPDIADQYNTVLKMAKKRALIDAVLTVFGASDLFTQDIDEKLPENEESLPPQNGQNKKPVETGTQKTIEERAKLFTILFEEEAKKTPLNAKEYDFCRLKFMATILGLPGTIVSSKTLTDEQFNKIAAAVKESEKLIPDFISHYLVRLNEKTPNSLDGKTK